MLVKVLKVTSWLMIAGLVITTIVPADERPLTGLPHYIEHSVAFSLAGLTFGLAYAGHRLRVLLPGAIVFALALELTQILLETRHARFEDFFINSAAGCLGIVVAYVWAQFDWE